MPRDELVIVRGAGDIATGVAHRLFRCGYSVIMTELAAPTVIRRQVSFAEAVYETMHSVEGVTGRLAQNARDAVATARSGLVAVVVDPQGAIVDELAPVAYIDATLAKRNLGTQLSDAAMVIGLGPGFTAGIDVHAVVETQRGHYLGRVITQGQAAPDTGIPGDIGGYREERILRAPVGGVFETLKEIGCQVNPGDPIAKVGSEIIRAGIGGVIRGLLRGGLMVFPGMKVGDIDPRGDREYCFTISDKARAVAGGVLEAILFLQRGERHA
ncbi:selenium-dependent molybdenum cofactor biosynthesis protein YqeB [Paradesulfitobacterium aromaticivorans]